MTHKVCFNTWHAHKPMTVWENGKMLNNKYKCMRCGLIVNEPSRWFGQ